MRATHLITGSLVTVLAIQSFTLAPANPIQAPTPIVIVEQRPLMRADAKEVAQHLLTKKHYKCLLELLTRESHWNPKAKNPTSTASGIGQLLEGTYRNLGMKHSEHEVPQLVATLAYIGRRYGAGGPCAAWNHWQENRWY